MEPRSLPFCYFTGIAYIHQHLLPTCQRVHRMLGQAGSFSGTQEPFLNYPPRSAQERPTEVRNSPQAFPGPGKGGGLGGPVGNPGQGAALLPGRAWAGRGPQRSAPCQQWAVVEGGRNVARGVGRRGGAGSQRQPLTCPGSSHFQASGGGARTTCRGVRGRGARLGAMAW